MIERDEKPVIQVDYRDETRVFQPEEISSMVLMNMKETAEAYLGKKVTKAVITVPGMICYFFFPRVRSRGSLHALQLLGCLC